jgi:hypothetical protein
LAKKEELEKLLAKKEREENLYYDKQFMRASEMLNAAVAGQDIEGTNLAADMALSRMAAMKTKETPQIRELREIIQSIKDRLQTFEEEAELLTSTSKRAGGHMVLGGVTARVKGPKKEGQVAKISAETPVEVAPTPTEQETKTSEIVEEDGKGRGRWATVGGTSIHYEAQPNAEKTPRKTRATEAPVHEEAEGYWEKSEKPEEFKVFENFEEMPNVAKAKTDSKQQEASKIVHESMREAEAIQRQIDKKHESLRQLKAELGVFGSFKALFSKDARAKVAAVKNLESEIFSLHDQMEQLTGERNIEELAADENKQEKKQQAV